MVREEEKKGKDPNRPSRPPLHSINIKVMINHFYLLFIIGKFYIKQSQFPNKIKIIL